jgi:hypothetical protein
MQDLVRELVSGTALPCWGLGEEFEDLFWHHKILKDIFI